MWCSVRRSGFSMLELVIAVTIFVLAFIPIVELLGTSRRVTAASMRLLEATMYAQTLLEGILPLDDEELPPGTGGYTILSSVQAAPAGSGRWTEVQKFFDQPPPFPMETRLVLAKRLPDPLDPSKHDRIVITVKIEFLRLVTDGDSEQVVVLEGLLDPRP